MAVVIHGCRRCTIDWINACLEGIGRGHEHYSSGLLLATKVLTNIFANQQFYGESTPVIDSAWNEASMLAVPVRSLPEQLFVVVVAVAVVTGSGGGAASAAAAVVVVVVGGGGIFICRLSTSA